jgi:hypothetical protein
MDAKQFDGFARRLASSASRRRAVGLLLAGGLGGSLSLRQGQEAEARCRPRNRKCNGICCPKGTYCHIPETQLCVSLQDTCDAGDNFCADGTEATRCGAGGGSPTCFCFQTFGGRTRCGNQATGCGTCSDDRKCKNQLGTPGAFCVKPKVRSGFCGNCGANKGFCATPCLT